MSTNIISIVTSNYYHHHQHHHGHRHHHHLLQLLFLSNLFLLLLPLLLIFCPQTSFLLRAQSSISFLQRETFKNLNIGTKDYFDISSISNHLVSLVYLRSCVASNINIFVDNRENEFTWPPLQLWFCSPAPRFPPGTALAPETITVTGISMEGESIRYLKPLQLLEYPISLAPASVANLNCTLLLKFVSYFSPQ